MEKLLLRPVEAARALGVGRSKLYRLLAARQLPAVRVGHSMRVPVESLNEWVKAREAEFAGGCSGDGTR